MPTLQTHSFPLSSLLCHASLPCAQPGTERHCTTFSTLQQTCARSQPRSQAPLRLRQGIRCPSGIRSHSLYMLSAEKKKHSEVCSKISVPSRFWLTQPQNMLDKHEEAFMYAACHAPNVLFEVTIFTRRLFSCNVTL